MVRHSGNAAGQGHIHKVKLHRAHLELELVSGDHLWHSGIFQATQGQIIHLAIPGWVGAMSTGDGSGHRWGRNSEFNV